MQAIDCDTHYWEPITVWHDYIDPAFRDRAPRFVEDGGRLLVQVGESVYPSAPQHAGFAAVYGPEENIREQVRLDKALSLDVARRLQHMDDDGTFAQIIFPTLGMVGFSGIQDPALAGACARAYNRFTAAFASADPKRLRCTMLIPFNHPEVAAEEMRYARNELGLDMAFTNPSPPGDHAWSNPEFDVVWRTAEELGVVVMLHESTVGAGPTAVGINRYAGRSPMIYLCTHTVEVQLSVMDLILGGVLERHPGLKVGLLEAHLTWITGWLQLMDSKFGAGVKARDTVLPLLPSDYFRRQIFAAAFPEDLGVREVIDFVGRENVVFSSDWPHPNLVPGEEPGWLDVVGARDDITDDEKADLLERNPRRWLNV